MGNGFIRHLELEKRMRQTTVSMKGVAGEPLNVSQSSVTLKNGDTWSLFIVSAKTSKTIAEQRNRREYGRNLVVGRREQTLRRNRKE